MFCSSYNCRQYARQLPWTLTALTEEGTFTSGITSKLHDINTRRCQQTDNKCSINVLGFINLTELLKRHFTTRHFTYSPNESTPNQSLTCVREWFTTWQRYKSYPQR
jgi:hypothetical protein